MKKGYIGIMKVRTAYPTGFTCKSRKAHSSPQSAPRHRPARSLVRYNPIESEMKQGSIEK